MLLSQGESGVACGADDFFETEGGGYEFDKKLLPKAHQWAQGKRFMYLTISNRFHLLRAPANWRERGGVTFYCVLQSLHSHLISERIRQNCQLGFSLVIVDNTHSQCWEAKEYVRIGLSYKYEVEIVEVTTPWARYMSECVRMCE